MELWLRFILDTNTCVSLIRGRNERILHRRTVRGKTGPQIRADAVWRKAQAKRPRHLDLMTPRQKDAFKRMLDRKFPPHPAIVAKAVAARNVG